MNDSAQSPPPRAAEAVLLRAAWGKWSPRQVWCTTLGWGQWAAAAAAQWPTAEITCQFLDQYQSDQARGAHPASPRVVFYCAADAPDLRCQLVAIPVSASGDGELVRDWLQQGFQLLEDEGELLASTDNPRDHWLRQELERLGQRVRAELQADGVVYYAGKSARPVKYKNFRAEYRFRDGARLLRVVTRPGVFSHRRLDTGARALIEAMEIEPGQQVLDLGCGSGPVTLAAACRAPGVHVEALDSNPRAIACLRESAALNELNNVSARLDASGDSVPAASCDVVVANPPYYSHGRIAEIFLRTAARGLRSGGRLWVVSKHPLPIADAMAQRFHAVQVQPARAYWIVSGRQG